MKNSAPKNEPKHKPSAKRLGLGLWPLSALLNQGAVVHLGLEHLGV
jgi:hypothetical protein